MSGPGKLARERCRSTSRAALAGLALAAVAGCSAASPHCRPGDNEVEEAGKVRCAAAVKPPAPGDVVSFGAGGAQIERVGAAIVPH